LELELPFEFFDGINHHRVEKLGGLAGLGFYFSSSAEQECCDRFAAYKEIESIAPVREG
jgi:hypothetical protein